MEEKNLALAILGVIAVLALVGLILHFKAVNTAKFIVSPYQAGPITEPASAQVYYCDRQGALGNVPKDFNMEVYSEEAVLARGTQYCVRAPAEIAPVMYCCQPQQP